MNTADSQAIPIRPEDVGKLHLRDHDRIDRAMALALLVQSPGASYWCPETGEFLIVTPWRHRSDILTIHTSGAFASEDMLIRAAIEHAGRHVLALVSVEQNETRSASFYVRNGLQRIEDIVTYEDRRPREHRALMGPSRQRFARVESIADPLFAQILVTDHEAFPWLWQNSVDEFQVYFQYPGVEVWAGLEEDDVVTYVGITHYRHWAHLDRIATRVDFQRRGFGAEALHFARERMIVQGARQVGLSTQGDNASSRSMYERNGFTRTRDDDYSIYGVIFDRAAFAGEIAR